MLRVLAPPGHAEKAIFSRPGDGQIAVIVPAYNEAASVADTTNSLLDQTLPPAKIIVVDDARLMELAMSHVLLGSRFYNRSRIRGAGGRTNLRPTFC